jgi:hypothetical protein
MLAVPLISKVVAPEYDTVSSFFAASYVKSAEVSATPFRTTPEQPLQ